ncbi:MAG: flagella basal body P-ring formation protein FlgA [Planctomycetota bacterium]|nr:MAG: flagella basal body P-ring formation protein FlgA [Planctomycetota bacterium]
MDRLTRLFVLVMSAMAASVGLAGVTTVTLRSTVRLEPAQPLTLGAIADIDGEQHATLAPMILDSDPVSPGAWTILEVDAIRERIAASPAREGSIVVIGNRCSITRRSERPAEPIQPALRPSPDPSVVTLRDHVESWMRARFNATESTIRLRFDDRDADLLATPTEGRLVEIGEIGVSGRMAVRVTVYENDTIVLTESLRAGVELLKPACVINRPIRRGAHIEQDDVRVEQVWSDPTQPPAEPAAVVGQSVRRSLQPGEVLRADHLEPPVVIQRGQDVSVRAVRGTVVVTTIARARSDARAGELVELEAKDRSGRRFTARVSGPGRAVMVEPGANTRRDTPLKSIDFSNRGTLRPLTKEELNQ